ncbi:molybdenum cofactor guanylyltransferase [Devosia salina]|uniref:Molybdenum cofactor guanylyltransferase n=1 Tax=Devosia salina TaxID=2860336 RepID=A0ABX8WHB5_9HYPH|nr:NTP transferase domain-containing protein [Devosia salina]QYO78263.1 NTP transferase domain-containing protein [Devosia salina]
MNAVGLILAGGSGSRLGSVRKADLRLGGQTLIERVVARLRVTAPPLLISTGRAAEDLTAFGTPVGDLELPLAGPLAGLAAAGQLLSGRDPETIVVTVAVDTPFLPPDYVERLVGAIAGGARAAQAGWQGNGYPTNAAWRLADLVDLAAGITAGTAPNSPKALLREHHAMMVDWSGSHAEDPFANLNTLADLVALAGRASLQPA